MSFRIARYIIKTGNVFALIFVTIKMKIMKYIIIISLFLISAISCKKSKTCEEPQLDCSGIRCIANLNYFTFRLINSSGDDVVFGTNPKYTSADIKLYSDVARAIPIQITFDASVKKIETNSAKEEMYLQISGGNVYKLSATFMKKECCSNTVKTLSQDGNSVCSCCGTSIPLVVN